MTMTSLATFVDGLEALTISGVTKKFTQGPPGAARSVQLPAQYVQFPNPALAENGLAFGGAGYDAMLRAELVVLVEAKGQNTQPVNFDATVAMVDAVTAALQGSAAHNLASGSPTWNIRVGVETVAGVEYWAVVATVEVQA
jgi:hypothetical protein